MRIYVAHTYGRRAGLSEVECEANVLRVIEMTKIIVAKGHNPYVPLLFHYVNVGWDESPDEPHWFKLVAEWIRFCDALFCGRKRDDSIRVAEEIRIASALNMPVYFNLDDIPKET